MCLAPLREVSRIPVCSRCLHAPEALSAEFFCVCCRTPFVNERPLDEQGRCALCRLGLNGFDGAYCFGPYEGKLRELIHLFKYEGVRTLAGPLGAWITSAAPRTERFDLVTPMPLHWWRKWRRGFNQSDLLARAVARSLGVPMAAPLHRRKATLSQAGLTNAQRRTNVAGAFRLRRGASVTGLRVLLVDDVMTTGATASACASALKRAGAAHVSVLTLARADRRMWTPAEPAGRRRVAAGVM